MKAYCLNKISEVALKTLNETILQQKENSISNTAEPNNQANNNFNNENKN